MVGSMMAERMERFPDVLSMHDNGWMIGSGNYLIVSTTKGTPKAIIDKLGAAFEAGMKTETVQNVVKTRYMKDVFIGPDKAGEVVKAELDKYAKLVADTKDTK